MSYMKKKIKKFIRYILNCKENEKITDAIDRHKAHIERKFYNKKITEDEFFKELNKLGISKGDVIMVHASWRKFYSYEGTPKDFIDRLIKLIGEEGTLLMPCYGDNKLNFDIIKTPSYAGVLSEEFRNYPLVKRSLCSHFSVCAYGKMADELTKHHIKSEFGFDEYSPYYLFCQLDNSKIVQLGMGKYPIKLTAIHCVEYIFKDTYKYFNRYLANHYEAKVVDKNGIISRRKMIAGGNARLYKRNINKIYKRIPKEKNSYCKLGNIDCRVLNAKAAFDEIIKATKNGEAMLNPPKTYNDSFELMHKD